MTDNMLSVLPPSIIGGDLMMFTERLINKPLRTTRRRARPFDRQEYKDNRRKVRGLGFGEFSNRRF